MPIGSPSGQLTRSTQIPTHARGKVRALVKAHKHWNCFLHKKGIPARQRAKNADLIEFALFYPELVGAVFRSRPECRHAPGGGDSVEARRVLQRERDARNIERLRQLLDIAERQVARARGGTTTISTTRSPAPY